MSRQRGFTLLEMVVVLTLLAVMAVGITSIYSTSVNQYLDATTRVELSAQMRFALERLRREIRNAVPNSVRVSGDGACLEFLPIDTAGIYHTLPQGAAANTLNTAPFSFASGASLTVMPSDAGDLYGPAPAQAALISSAVAAPNNEVQVTLSRSLAFPLASPGKRFFVFSQPVSFCLASDGSLRRYASYGSSVSQPTPGAGLPAGDRLADRLITGSPVFAWQAGGLSRNALVQISLQIRDRDETQSFHQEVLLRNVP